MAQARRARGPHGSGGGRWTRPARRPARATREPCRGLEGALVDRDAREITRLEGGGRRFEILVAGPAALLVSKLHKLAERADEPGRLKDKDALDVLRLLRGVRTGDLADRIRRLRADPRSAAVTAEALAQLERLFARLEAPGSTYAARAAEGLELADTIKASCAALTQDLLAAVRRA